MRMGKTSYDLSQPGTQQQQVYDNPTFINTERQGSLTPATVQEGEFPSGKEIRKFQEIPLDRTDVIKLLFLLTFVLAAFVVGVVVTGSNV